MKTADSIAMRRAIVLDKLKNKYDEFNGRQLGLILVPESDCRAPVIDSSPYPIAGVFLCWIDHPQTQTLCRVSVYGQVTDAVVRGEEFRQLVRQCGALLSTENDKSKLPSTQAEPESAAWISLLVKGAVGELVEIPLDDIGTVVWSIMDPWLRSIALAESLGWGEPLIAVPAVASVITPIIPNKKAGRKPATIGMITEACEVWIAYEREKRTYEEFCNWWNGEKQVGCAAVTIQWLKRQLALVRKLMRDEPHRIPSEFANKLKPLRRVKSVAGKMVNNSSRSR